VPYEAVNAMLLDEFLKEHRKVEELEAAVARQQKDFEATAVQLQSVLKQRVSQIQKVTAQLAIGGIRVVAATGLEARNC
jgi:hypothetical protein